MEMRSSGYGIVLVILICALATANIVECRKRVPLTFDDGDGGAGDDLVIDDKMVCETCPFEYFVQFNLNNIMPLITFEPI